MQILIKNFKCSDNNYFKNREERYILEINNNYLIIKNNFRLNKKEVFKISFNGWHNIDIKYDNTDNNVNIKVDIFIKEDSKYRLENLKLSFTPLQTYNLDKILNYLNDLNSNLNKDNFKIVEEIKKEESKKLEKIKEIKLLREEKFREEELKLREIEQNKLEKFKEIKLLREEKLREEKLRLEEIKKDKVEKFRKAKIKFEEFKKSRLEVEEKEKERLRDIELQNINSNIKKFIYSYNKIKDDEKIKIIYSNFFKKYLSENFIDKKYYILISNYLVKNNYIYNISKEVANDIFSTADYEYYKKIFEIESNYLNNYELKEFTYIDNLIEFIQENYKIFNRDYIKLITWFEICKIAIDYYANLFNNLYGREFEDIDNLDINQCVYKYICLDTFDKNNYIFIYFLMKNKKYIKVNRYYISCIESFEKIYNIAKEKKKYNAFINSILIEDDNKNTYTIEDVDLMTGSEFEEFISKLFSKMGYKTMVTKASGDQGIDVIAERKEIRIGIQVKCYSNTVSNSAIQEVVAGISYYKCNKAIVITNNYFTNSAIELAKANNVILWDREILKQKIIEIF